MANANPDDLQRVPLFEELDRRQLRKLAGLFRERTVNPGTRIVAEEYDGDAARIWRDATDAKDLRKRIGALPGFGEMKIKSLGAVLAKQFGVKAAEELAPDHPTLGDVTSPEELDRYQGWKRAYKKASKGA